MWRDLREEEQRQQKLYFSKSQNCLSQWAIIHHVTSFYSTYKQSKYCKERDREPQSFEDFENFKQTKERFIRMPIQKRVVPKNKKK